MTPDERAQAFFAKILADTFDLYDVEIIPPRDGQPARTVIDDDVWQALRRRAEASGLDVETMITDAIRAECMIINQDGSQ